jgi:hypothetical protein
MLMALRGSLVRFIEIDLGSERCRGDLAAWASAAWASMVSGAPELVLPGSAILALKGLQILGLLGLPGVSPEQQRVPSRQRRLLRRSRRFD